MRTRDAKYGQKVKVVLPKNAIEQLGHGRIGKIVDVSPSGHSGIIVDIPGIGELQFWPREIEARD